MASSTKSLDDVSLESQIISNDTIKRYNVNEASAESIVNDDKVTDHHAVLPTQSLTKDANDALPQGDKNSMILIVCVDDEMGMLFNKRRQSQDKILRERILSMTVNSRLWTNEYTARQFELDIAPQINIDDNFMSEALMGEYCFAENIDVSVYERSIEKIVLFKWNRIYPSDLRFNIDMTKWMLVETSEFSGSSHDKIVMEVYVR
jgi:hypothetical protein